MTPLEFLGAHEYPSVFSQECLWANLPKRSRWNRVTLVAIVLAGGCQMPPSLSISTLSGCADVDR